MVTKIIGPHERKLTDGFLKLQSHYLFREHFCRVARANEKGVVEGVVKFSRSNFLVPVPRVKDFDELNAMLFDKWTEVFGSERLTGALLDRLTHKCHILEANGESHRLRQAKKRSKIRSPRKQFPKQKETQI